MNPWLAAVATFCSPFFLLLLGGFFLSSGRDAHMPHRPGDPERSIWPSLLVWFFAPAGLALGYILAGDSARGLRAALGGYVLLVLITIIVLAIAAMVYAGICGFGAFNAAENSYRP